MTSSKFLVPEQEIRSRKPPDERRPIESEIPYILHREQIELDCFEDSERLDWEVE